VFLIALGLTKKRRLPTSSPKPNGYFSSDAAHPGAPAAWSGVFAFGLQIYFDFSGYTDMAIGMAKLFVHFPINFGARTSGSMTDFGAAGTSRSPVARDYLYSPGRQPEWPLAHLPQPDAPCAARRRGTAPVRFSDLAAIRNDARHRARPSRRALA
jgi:hypothetical protein